MSANGKQSFQKPGDSENLFSTHDHEWEMCEEYGGHIVTRCKHCRIDRLREMVERTERRAAIARARGGK